MLIRLMLNATAHTVAGVAVGLMAYTLVRQYRKIEELKRETASEAFDDRASRGGEAE